MDRDEVDREGALARGEKGAVGERDVSTSAASIRPVGSLLLTWRRTSLPHVWHRSTATDRSRVRHGAGLIVRSDSGPARLEVVVSARTRLESWQLREIFVIAMGMLR